MRQALWTTRWWWRLPLILLVGLAMLWGTFGYTSICTHCGRTQSTFELQIPGTPICYFWWHSTSATPLSRVVAANGLALGPAHHWLFAAGGGNGAMCAIGSGRYLGSAVDSPAIAGFFAAMNAYRGGAATQAWLNALLNARQPYDVSNTLQIADLPATRFTTSHQFDAWWNAHQDVIDDLCTRLPKLTLPPPPTAAPAPPATAP